MNENYQLAFQLLIVGMSAVFFILGVVVLLGNALVLGVNKFAPNNESVHIPKVKSLENKKIAVISAVVELITHRKGVVESIKKL